MALPNLKYKIFELSTPKSKTHIISSNSNRYSSTFSIQKSVEILESMEIPRTPRHSKTISTNEVISKELKSLEQELDSHEINMLAKSLSCEQVFKVYMNFLDSISNVMKFKDEKLSKLMIRGLAGCEKSFFKGLAQQKPEISLNIPQVIVKTQTQDKSMQASLVPEFKENTEADYLNLKNLPKSLKNIKLSRISYQLAELYETLNRLHTDIPQPTPICDFEPMDIIEDKKGVSLKLTIIRENLNKFIEKKTENKKKLGISKITQTEGETKTQLVTVLETMNNEKEISMMRLKSMVDNLEGQNGKLQENLLRASGMWAEMERKNGVYEMELTKIKSSLVEYQDKYPALEKKHRALETGFTTCSSENKKLKKLVKNLTNLLKKKQKDLQDLLDQLYNTQIIWKIAEKKLKNIEKSWESSNGNPFEYKDININNIINKNGFKKIVLKDIENEIQESVQGEIDFNEPILISQENLTLIDHPELIMKSGNTKKKHLNSRRGSKKLLDSRRSSVLLLDELSSGKSSRTPSFSSVNLLEQDPMPTSSKKHSEKTVVMNSEISIHGIKKKEDASMIYPFIPSDAYLTAPKDIDENEVYSEISMKVPMRNSKVVGEDQVKKSEPVATKEKYLKESEERMKNEMQGNNEGKRRKETGEIKYSVDINPLSKESNSIYRRQNLTDNYEVQVDMPKETVELSRNILTSNEVATATAAASKTNNTEAVLDKNLQVSHKNSKNRSKQLTKKFEIDASIIKNIPQSENTITQHSVSFPANQESPKGKSNEINPNFLNAKSTNTSSTNPRKSHRRLSDQDAILVSQKLSNPESVLISIAPSDDHSNHDMNIFCESFIDSNNEASSFDLSSPSTTQKILNPHEKFQSVQKLEEEWMSTLTSDQRKSYSFYKEKLDEYKRVNVSLCSKAVQCLLLQDSSEKTLSGFEIMRQQPQIKELLSKVFESPEEIDRMPVKLKIELGRSLKGHERQQCAEMCIHLQRVMKLKRKHNGKLYPVKIIKM